MVRPHHPLNVRVLCAERRHEQDDIRLVRVERAVSLVCQLHAPASAPGLQYHVAGFKYFVIHPSFL